MSALLALAAALLKALADQGRSTARSFGLFSFGQLPWVSKLYVMGFVPPLLSIWCKNSHLVMLCLPTWYGNSRRKTAH